MIDRFGRSFGGGGFHGGYAMSVMPGPHLLPYALTVADAASPDVSLRFFFYGGVVVLPVIVVYTIGVYWVFRGKIGRLKTSRIVSVFRCALGDVWRTALPAAKNLSTTRSAVAMSSLSDARGERAF